MNVQQLKLKGHFAGGREEGVLCDWPGAKESSKAVRIAYAPLLSAPCALRDCETARPRDCPTNYLV